MEDSVKICSNCIMDTSDPDIVFDENGVCNHCHRHWAIEKQHVIKGNLGQIKINQIVEEIKKRKSNKKYDCIIGVSGGVDSSYLLYLLSKYNLKPLAVHFDNGWNTEESVQNIHRLTDKLNIDLYTYVIDWEKFRDLQLAYLKASVIDIDVPTDQLIFSSLYKVARKYNIKSLIIGYNVATETVMPDSWYFKRKLDQKNLRAIHKKYGEKKLTDFPKIGSFHKFYYNYIFKLKSYSPLNYIDYNKVEAKKFLMNEFGWKDYGGKHFENIFTRFYQGYILPVKFGVDKNRAHLSNMILSKQITREEALIEIQKKDYTKELIDQDKQYFIKKFNLTEKEFEDIMSLEIQPHENFPIENPLFEEYPILRVFKPIVNLIKKI